MQTFKFSKHWMTAFAGCIITLYIVFMMRDKPIHSFDKWFLKEKNDFEKILSKLHLSATNCNGLVGNWSKHNMSSEYYRLLPLFQLSLAEAMKIAPDAEGHSGQLPLMTNVLHMLASSDSINTVCETGFNFGHSSFNFLSSNKNLKVHTFDIGIHAYARKMAESMKVIFKDRINIHFGDSTQTVPVTKTNGILPLCDLIFVDGGHSYGVARADLINFGSHANPDNLVILDDYPTGWGASFGKAWEDLLVRGESIQKAQPLDVSIMKNKSLEELQKVLGIVELMRCSVGPVSGLERAFTFGRYVLKPV